MYHFEGTFNVTKNKEQIADFSIGLKSFLPRGAVVCNSVVRALVVYTGKDTKIIQN